jgi:putative phosphonate metabolism protein
MSARSQRSYVDDEARTMGAIAAEWPDGARFAIYYAPPRESPWWQAGCVWLGRDPETRGVYAPPALAALRREVADLTAAPRRYGWHGTLVAPFRLAIGISAHDVSAAARAWAARQSAFALPVEAALLGRFVALRPADAEGDTALGSVAADALRSLDALRARPPAAEIERRLAAPLTARQRELLLAWGYPYVFEEFRFHMTLSDSLSDDTECAALIDHWRAEVARFGPLPFDGAALFVEPAPGEPFVLWQRLPFGAPAADALPAADARQHGREAR